MLRLVAYGLLGGMLSGCLVYNDNPLPPTTGPSYGYQQPSQVVVPSSNGGQPAHPHSAPYSGGQVVR